MYVCPSVCWSVGLLVPCYFRTAENIISYVPMTTKFDIYQESVKDSWKMTSICRSVSPFVRLYFERRKGKEMNNKWQRGGCMLWTSRLLQNRAKLGTSKWILVHLKHVFQFLSHLRSPQLLGTHFFGFLGIFYAYISYIWKFHSWKLLVLMRLLAKFLENLPFFANFSIFLTLAAFPASWDPFFRIPCKFLRRYRSLSLNFLHKNGLFHANLCKNHQ